MNEFIPKFGDVKALKDLAKVFAFPVLAVAYILQTGMQIEWNENVWFDLGSNLPEEIQFNRFLIIVIAKALWSSIFGGIAYLVLAAAHIFIWDMVLPIIAMVLFTFGFLGLFQFGFTPKFEEANAFWFYACFVWGFFMFTIKEQFENIS